jgi:hypothetical protein
MMADSFNVLTPGKRLLEVRDEKRHWPKALSRVMDYFERRLESEPFIVGRVS